MLYGQGTMGTLGSIVAPPTTTKTLGIITEITYPGVTLAGGFTLGGVLKLWLLEAEAVTKDSLILGTA